MSRVAQPEAHDEQGRPIYGYNAKNEPVCYSLIAGTGRKKHCQSKIRMSNGRCKKHGGVHLPGPLNHAWQHGRYSSVIPKHLQVYHQEMHDNPDLLSLRDDIALGATRLRELIAGIKGDPDELTMAAFAEIASLMVQAIETIDDQAEQLTELRTLCAAFINKVRKGKNVSAHWSQIMSMQEHVSKLAEKEVKRLEAGRKQMSIEDAWLMFDRLQQSVKRHVQEPDVLLAIALDVQDLTQALKPRPVPVALNAGTDHQGPSQ